MSSILDNVPLDLIRPAYNIYRYTDSVYKIVHFKHTLPSLKFSGESQHYDYKLDSSISRTRRKILELALCNDWSWFATFTISSSFDRSDLKTFNKKFKQWLRDLRKKYSLPFRFLLVPEQHKDGSWHMHGLMDDSPSLISFSELHAAGQDVPLKLVLGGFYNWPEYQRKFGFCSFGRVRDKVAVAFYVSKYISKSLADSCMPVGLDLFSASDGLNRPEFQGEVFSETPALNKCLTNHYEFCDTGFAKLETADWSYSLEYMDYEFFQACDLNSDILDQTLEDSFNTFYEGVQEAINGF